MDKHVRQLSMSAQDDSARLTEAIKEALAPHALKPLSHDALADAKQAVGDIEAQMRSGAFGGYFISHDIVIGYDTFGTLTWRFVGKF